MVNKIDWRNVYDCHKKRPFSHTYLRFDTQIKLSQKKSLLHYVVFQSQFKQERIKNEKDYRIFLSMMLIIASSVQAFAFDNQEYNYGVDNNSKVWSTLDHQQKIDATNISEKVLENMDTEALLDVVLKYPLLVDLFAFNSIEEGINVVKGNFLGMNVLLQREDLGEQIVNKYVVIKNDIIASENNDINQDSAFNKLVLDALLSTSSIGEKLSDKQSEILISTISEIYKKTNKMPAFWDDKSAIAQNVEINAVATYVTTPKGSRVYAEINGELLSQADKNTLHQQAIAAYPNITKVRDATTNYNCHSYAWYSTSSSNIYWIPQPSYYLTDGSYTNVGQYPTGINQKLYYPLSKYEHTAIINSYGSGTVINSSVKCTSKWGMMGLYKHNATDCPYYVGGALYKVYK